MVDDKVQSSLRTPVKFLYIKMDKKNISISASLCAFHV